MGGPILRGHYKNSGGNYGLIISRPVADTDNKPVKQ
jgi:hypothetical protein